MQFSEPSGLCTLLAPGTLRHFLLSTSYEALASTPSTTKQEKWIWNKEDSTAVKG